MKELLVMPSSSGQWSLPCGRFVHQSELVVWEMKAPPLFLLLLQPSLKRRQGDCRLGSAARYSEEPSRLPWSQSHWRRWLSWCVLCFGSHLLLNSFILTLNNVCAQISSLDFGAESFLAWKQQLLLGNEIGNGTKKTICVCNLADEKGLLIPAVLHHLEPFVSEHNEASSECLQFTFPTSRRSSIHAAVVCFV